MEAFKLRAGMPLPDVPPRNPGDPVPHELIIPFLDAVARKMEAFRELREKILPKWNPPKAPVKAIEKWLAKWRLDSFADHRLNENIQSWVYQVLNWWKRDPGAARELRVDCGIDFEKEGRGTRVVKICRYDGREKPAVYAARIKARAEKLMTEEIALFEQHKQKYGLRDFKRRDRGRDFHERFEWLALSLCAGQSDEDIAGPYRIAPGKRDLIRKSRDALYKLGFNPRVSSARK